MKNFKSFYEDKCKCQKDKENEEELEEQLGTKLKNIGKGFALGLALSPLAYTGGKHAGHTLRGMVDSPRSPTSSQVSPAPNVKSEPTVKKEDQKPTFKDLSHGMIKHFEGFREQAYADELTKDKIPTIGWGMTRHANGRKVKLGDKITREEADKHLEQHVEEMRAHLAENIPHWNEMQPHHHAALISFAHNFGKNFYGSTGSKFASIRKALQDKDWEGVPVAMAKYNKSNGKVEKGLVRRRTTEGAMWQGRVAGFNEKGEPVIQDENK